MNYPRTNYEMTEEDLTALMDSFKSAPMIMLQCGGPSSPQENANRAWERLGNKMGFDYMTVRPDGNKGPRFFTAIPSETESARDERMKTEAEKQRAHFLELKEMADRMQREVDEQNAAEQKRLDDIRTIQETHQKNLDDIAGKLQANQDAAHLERERVSALAEASAMANEIAAQFPQAATKEPVDGPEMITIPVFEYDKIMKAFRDITSICNTPGYLPSQAFEKIAGIAEEWA